MPKKPKQKKSESTKDIGRNTAIVLVIAIAVVAYWVITNPITTTVVLVLGVIVALVVAVGHYFGGGVVGVLSKLFGGKQ